MRPIFFILISFAVLIVVVLSIAVITKPKKQVSISDDSAISQKAVELYQKTKEQGADFSNGPCLGTIDYYAIDIAHIPREVVDEKSENQCPDYINGKLKHFVELTPFGTIIRVK